MNVRVLTLNIHKGFTQLNARFMLHELRDAIRSTHADVVFLQEVQGEHVVKANRHQDWPDQSQYEFLADEIWTDFAYGRNAVYEKGHHGNAILSKFPIAAWEQLDVSTNRIEQRGILWAKLDLGGEGTIHGICVHLGLSAAARRKQLRMIADFIKRRIPRGEPYIVAGDFNDWSGVPTSHFARILGLTEAHYAIRGAYARTFPAKRPFLRLDKVYVRGVRIEHADTHADGIWNDLSDHAALTVDLHVDT